MKAKKWWKKGMKEKKMQELKLWKTRGGFFLFQQKSEQNGRFTKKKQKNENEKKKKGKNEETEK